MNSNRKHLENRKLCQLTLLVLVDCSPDFGDGGVDIFGLNDPEEISVASLEQMRESTAKKVR